MTDHAHAYITHRDRWPDAYGIRIAGRCHECRNHTMFSFVLPPHIPIWELETNEESCGYVCVNCGWSNAGSRTYYDDAG